MITTNILKDALEEGFKQQADKVFDELKFEFVNRLELERSKFVAGMALHLMSKIRMDRTATELIITVENAK